MRSYELKSLVPVWLLFAVLSLLFALKITPNEPVLNLLMLFSALLVGLPHGATDHFIPFDLSASPVSLREMILVFAVYIGLLGVYCCFWFWQPAWAFFGFLLITWFHWGQTELECLLSSLSESQSLPSLLERVCFALLRGGLPIVCSAWAFPQDFERFAQTITGLFGLQASQSALVETLPALMASLLPLLVLAALVYHLGSWGKFSLSHSYFVLAESILLILFFCLVPPQFSIPLYLFTQHALKHIFRLMRTDPVSEALCQQGQVPKAWVRFFWRALPTSLLAYSFLGLFYLALPSKPAESYGLFALYLAFISSLTFPHTITVLWMDWRQRVWHA